jgi:LCP family protein required for cell wall assembly
MSYQSPARSSGPTVAIIGVLALIVLAVILFFLLSNQGAAPVATPSATASAAPTEGVFNEELLNQRLTVLVVGTDANAERESRGEPANTDALMLASVSADQSQVALIGLPRDTVDIPLPDGSTWDQKVNALMREEGVDTLVGAMEELFGVPIDYHLVLDMDDFATFVDGVGGVEVEVEDELIDPPIDLQLQPGTQELDGETTLKYVRTRVDDDYARAERQQQVLLALISRLVDHEPDDIAQLIEGLDSLETDLPLEDLPTLVELARRAQSAQVEREVLRPPEFITFEGDEGDGRGYILIPDVEAIRALAQEQLAE